MKLQFPAAVRETMLRIPLDEINRITRGSGKPRYRGQYDECIKAANLLQERGEPVTSAAVAALLQVVNAGSGIPQYLAAALGREGLGLEVKTVRGKKVYELPAGGITRELVEQSFDCCEWDWSEDDRPEEPLDPELVAELDRDWGEPHAFPGLFPGKAADSFAAGCEEEVDHD
jgi:hypothetical protein